MLETGTMQIKDEDETVERHWCSINRRMLAAKLVCFLDFAKTGCLYEYMLVFYVSIGLDPAKAGLICGIQLAGALVGGPFWGLIADKTLRHRLVTKILCMLSIILVCFTPFMSLLLGEHEKNVCPLRLNSTANISTLGQEKFSDGGNMKLFYSLLILTTSGFFFHGPTSVFAMSGILKVISISNGRNDIGRQNVLGPAGFALGGFLTGILVDYFPASNITCYAGMYLVYAVFTVCLGVGFHFLFTDKVIGHTSNGMQNDTNVTELLSRTLRRLETWIFLVIVLFNGTTQGLLLSFSFLFLKEMRASASLMGFSMLVSGASSVLFFYFSKYILKAVGGPIGMMALTCFFRFVRCLCLYYMGEAYIILAINAMNGLNTSLFVVAYMEYIKDKFPGRINTVMCGVVVMLYNYGGAIISFIGGGKMYMTYGGRHLFLLCGIACAVFSVITFVYAIVEKIECKKRSDEELDVENEETRGLNKEA